MTPSQLLDPADRLRVESTVFEARKATSCPIVVMVVRASDDYPGAGWRLGLLLAVLASLGVSILLPSTPLLEILAFQGLGLAAGHGLARSDALRRRLVSARLAEASVERRATQAFAEQGLRRGRGVLVFVSLLERRARVLADGIPSAAPGELPWQQVLDPVLEGMAEGRAAQGLVRAVERCAELLVEGGSHPGDCPDTPGLVLED